MKKLVLALVLFGIALNANADLSGPAVIVDGDTLSEGENTYQHFQPRPVFRSVLIMEAA